MLAETICFKILQDALLPMLPLSGRIADLKPILILKRNYQKPFWYFGLLAGFKKLVDMRIITSLDIQGNDYAPTCQPCDPPLNDLGVTGGPPVTPKSLSCMCCIVLHEMQTFLMGKWKPTGRKPVGVNPIELWKTSHHLRFTNWTCICKHFHILNNNFAITFAFLSWAFVIQHILRDMRFFCSGNFPPVNAEPCFKTGSRNKESFR